MTTVEVISPAPPGTGAEGQGQVGEAHTNGAVLTAGARKSLELGRNSVSLSCLLLITVMPGCMSTRAARLWTWGTPTRCNTAVGPSPKRSTDAATVYLIKKMSCTRCLHAYPCCVVAGAGDALPASRRSPAPRIPATPERWPPLPPCTPLPLPRIKCSTTDIYNSSEFLFPTCYVRPPLAQTPPRKPAPAGPASLFDRPLTITLLHAMYPM